LELASLRDLVLVAWGLIASVAAVYLCVIISILYRRLNSFMSAMNEAALKIGEIADQAQEDVFIPLARIGSVLRGINQGLSFINKLFNKKEK
jgi:ABC-type spermidine/putrescine transport system permease subunit II